ncbi:uroporphyrin-III C-methyltransferase [Viridothelium virens]|uniref:Uroporphyrin-III C-methyltransferase n=1 Tax=Viridothelium virens TaxID=1048519 RepID=A0A6A6GUT1_VIRVR|nr:uroporphyrin-III C-methyltransferase [Viridothelium virens]
MFPALLTASDCTSHVHLVIGSNPLAGARCTKSLEVGAKPILIAPEDSRLHYGLVSRIDAGEVRWIKREFQDNDLTTLGREEVDYVVDAVFVTKGRQAQSPYISNLCRRLRIPVNVADAPNLCTFTILSTHSDGPLQIGVTTSGKGCKMASRIRREISKALPPNLGTGVERLGIIRRRIWEEDHAAEMAVTGELEDDDDGEGQTSAFNRLITPEDVEAVRTRRMRWLAQICEYWPLARLASLTDADIDSVLKSYPTTLPSSANTLNSSPSTHATPPPPPLPLPSPLLPPRRGLIILAGSGPGHPSLLTLATLHAIRAASLILADKLVPSGILALIPRRTPVEIARKFPGNADAAQDELLRLGLSALEQGKTVVRLKQGDPYLYGRGAEELAWFRERGWGERVLVLPGVTSALAGPLFAGVPATHRGVADQVVVLTGTGRKGARTESPAFGPTRTCVFLMALHRLGEVVKGLAGQSLDSASGGDGLETKERWPEQTPCAVIERASCPDQRVIRTTLEFVCAAVEEEGSRPPGLLVVGAACEVLHKPKQRWVVEEGLGINGNIEELGRVGDWNSLQEICQKGTAPE